MDNKDAALCVPLIKSGYAKQLRPLRYFVLPMIAVFVTLFVTDFVQHCVLLLPRYKETAYLWRSEAQIEVLCYINVICQFSEALIITAIFRHLWFMKYLCGMRSFFRSGVLFGLKIGVLIGVVKAGFYASMPIPEDIILSWFGGEIIQGLLVGIVLGLCYCSCSKEKKENA